MPEATRDIHDSQDLGGQVDALLGELQSAPAPPVEHANGTATPALNGTANGAAPAADPTANGVAAASEPVLPPTLPPPPAPPAPVAAIGEPAAGPGAQAAAPGTGESDEDLAKAVEKLLEEVPENQPLPAPAAPAGAQPAEKIESLDAELAGLADDLIAGEFASESEVLKEDAAAAPAATMPEADAAAESVTEEIKQAPAKRSLAAAVAARTEPEAKAPTVQVSDQRGALPKPVAVAVAEPASPSLLVRVAAVISAPLANKPQHVRDALGWNALWVAFLGGCVWAYILFFRSNEPPMPVEPMPAPAAEHSSEKGEAEGHGSSEHAPSKKDKAPAKKSTAKKGSKAEASHH